MDNLNINDIIKNQKRSINDLEKFIQDQQRRDLNKENENLKITREKLQKELEKTKIEFSKIKEDHGKLKSLALKKYYDERTFIINDSKRKMDGYFERIENQGVNNLKSLELKLIKKINVLKNLLKQNYLDTNSELLTELEVLQKKVHDKIAENEKFISEQSEKLNEESKLAYDKLKEEKVSDEIIKKQSINRNFEFNIGSKATNIAGILFVILAILLMAQYTYTRFFMNNTAKAILFYVLGIVFLSGGEYLSRKGKNYFSLGITSGGIAILFISTAISYFYFNILGMIVAAVLCVLISAISFGLSLKYNRQLISIFAIIGGYLPITALIQDGSLLYSVLIYFMILNVFATLIAFKKRWIITSYFSVVFNFVSLFYILNINVDVGGGYTVFAIKMVYTLVTLLFYITITLINPVKNIEKLKIVDVVLVAISVFFGTVLTYTLLYSYKLNFLNGVFAILFFGIFYAVGKLIEKKTNDKPTTILFYLTALVFAILVVPFQFGKEYVTLGWLVMGTVIGVFGITRKEKYYGVAGLSILGICGFSFYFNELNSYNWLSDGNFLFHYSAITFAYTLVLFVICKNYSNTQLKLKKLFLLVEIAKNILFFNFALYIIMFANYFIHEDWKLDIIIILEIFFGMIICKIKIINTKSLEISSCIFIGILFLVVSCKNYFIGIYTFNVDFALTICLNLLYVYAVHLTVNKISKIKLEYAPLVKTIIYLFLVLTILQNRYIHLGIVNSIIFICAALICVVYGFFKNNMSMRRFGLILVFCAITKLFIFDLTWLNIFQKIISYFIFGFILIGISYVYQLLIKKFEVIIKNEDVENNKHDNDNMLL